MTPANVPITAWRNARYVEEFAFVADGAPYDLTSWSSKMQVRLYGAAPGSPAINLANVGGDSEGAWIIEPAAGVVRARIDEATLESVWSTFAGPNEPNQPLVLVYDLVLTTPTGADEVWIYGTFTIYPGVTV